MSSDQQKVPVEVEGRKLVLSNLDKVLYPAAGFTKAQVIDYYQRIAAVLLPHIAQRPVTIKRYPDGVDGKFFFQKNAPGGTAGLGPDGQAAVARLDQVARDDRVHPRRRPADADLGGQPRRA